MNKRIILAPAIEMDVLNTKGLKVATYILKPSGNDYIISKIVSYEK